MIVLHHLNKQTNYQIVLTFSIKSHNSWTRSKKQKQSFYKTQTIIIPQTLHIFLWTQITIFDGLDVMRKPISVILSWFWFGLMVLGTIGMNMTVTVWKPNKISLRWWCPFCQNSQKGNIRMPLPFAYYLHSVSYILTQPSYVVWSG
jgi:hypothetical protein